MLIVQRFGNKYWHRNRPTECRTKIGNLHTLMEKRRIHGTEPPASHADAMAGCLRPYSLTTARY